ncbi:MAG: hypothetical protein ACE5HJ_02460 [Thermoplasmata archaeon]
MGRTDTIWEEHRKWLHRKRELEEALEDVDREESFLLEELDRVEEQVAYYGSLTKEMKKTLDPPKLAHLLRSWRKV